jgi:hypothetical protein
MKKPNKTFKLDKQSKKILSRMVGQTRSDYKKMMIDAQLCSEVVVSRDKKKGKDKDET